MSWIGLFCLIKQKYHEAEKRTQTYGTKAGRLKKTKSELYSNNAEIHKKTTGNKAGIQESKRTLKETREDMRRI